MRKKFLFSSLIVALILLSCDKEEIDTKIEFNQQDERGKLISYQFINTIPASNINDLYPERLEYEGDVSHLPNYDINLYRILYASLQEDKLVELSGLIVVPITDEPISHMQYHHGTMFPYPFPEGEGSLDAPSLYTGLPTSAYDAQAESRIFGNYLGSYGYLVSMPDYAGYAKSSDLEHPYSVNTLLAEQSVDMILATKEFCAKENIRLDRKLFLSGWSEGAAAAVAVQKLIEVEYLDEIEVTANAPLAGFYNTSYYANLMLNYFPLINEDLGADIDVLIWTLYAMNRFSDDPILNSDLFKFEVNDQLDVLQNRPTSRPSNIVRILTEENRNSMMKSFRKNALAHNWSPKAPIFVHQGTEDDIVFYYTNTEVMVNNLNRNGGDVTLYAYEGHDHYSLVMLYLLKMIEDFEHLR